VATPRLRRGGGNRAAARLIRIARGSLLRRDGPICKEFRTSFSKALMSDSYAHAARRRASRGDQPATLFSTVHDLWPYIWPTDRADLKARALGAVGILLAAKLVTMAVPYAFKWATDALAPGAKLDEIPLPGWMIGAVALTVVYGALRILMALLTQGRDALFAAVAMNAVRRMAIDVFTHLHRLSLRFHLERKTGGLTRVLERGRNAIETIVRMSMLTAVPTAVEFLLIVAVFLWSFDWRYVAVVTATIVVYMWFTTAATQWRMAIRKKMNDSDSDANTKAIDSLLNFETVKYFGAERREGERYDKAMARYERLSVDTYTSLAVLNAGQAVIFTIGLAAVMIMCVQGIRAGTHTVGDFVMINAIMIQLSQPLNFMGMLYRELKQSTVDIEQMFKILDQNPEIEDRPGAPALRVEGGAIRFEDVRFSYDPSREILRGVSFEAKPGQTVAIVGPSGAGKSTISRLMFRFYEPTQGRILIDGQDIAEVTQFSLREKIGMVPQDTVLFNDTIGYNIRYGRWDASDEELRQAADDAQIGVFVEHLPQGYDTPVGERGLKLSGGEKQRVAIARTILKAPPILVLDEATSALDTFTEREIQSALDRVSRGRTTLVIAHRLSTVVNADQILVLDKGEIVERGAHEELLALGGVYAALWSRQREVDEAQEAIRRAQEAEPKSLRVAVAE
jgi:ABC-type transport system involved in Fe-S cluster assembly fused permease/ATPase subunit